MSFLKREIFLFFEFKIFLSYLGVMNPPVLVDLNNDGTVDITMAMYNTTVIAFDGENYKRLWHFVFSSSESYT